MPKNAEYLFENFYNFYFLLTHYYEFDWIPEDILYCVYLLPNFQSKSFSLSVAIGKSHSL